MPSSPNQQEQIDIRILRLIGLEDVFDLDYGTYLSLLKEVMVKGRMTKTSIPTEEIELVTKEFKRVKSKKDKGRFKVKSKKISASKLTGGSVAAIAGSVKALAPSMGSSLVAVSKKTTGGGESDSDPLTEIKESLDRIAGLLIQQLANLKATGEKERRAAENKRREARETRLEKGFAVVTKVAKKIVAPVKSILDKIINFFVTIFLGRAVFKLLSWFGDPANKKKVDAIFRFLGDQWPKLIAAYLLFGNSLGRFITRLSVRLLKAIATFALRNPKLAGVVGGIALGGFLADFFSKNNPFQTEERDRDADRTVTEFNQGGFVSGQSGIDKIPAMLTDGEFVMSRGAVQQFGLDTLLAMNAAGGGTNRPRVVSGVSFAQGGGPIGSGATKGGNIFTRLGTHLATPIERAINYAFPVEGRPTTTRGLAHTPLKRIMHGTSFGAPESIRATGFREQMGMLGKGVYGSKKGWVADTYRGAGAFKGLLPGQGPRLDMLVPEEARSLRGATVVSARQANRGLSIAEGILSGKYTGPKAQSLKPLLTTPTPTMGQAFGKMGALRNLKGGTPIQVLANIAIGGLLDKAVDAISKPAGDALARTLLYMTGHEEKAKNRIPSLYGMSGPDLPMSTVQRLKKSEQVKPAMRFAGGPASTLNRSYTVPPPIQNKTMVRYVNTPSGSSGGGGYGSDSVSTREIPTFSAVIADSRRRSKAAQLGIG